MTEYTVTPEDFKSITDVDLAFGTTKLLPPEDAIPKEFFQDNPYSEIVNCLFFGKPMPPYQISFNPGVDETLFVKAVRAHIASFEPDHNHKIAGVAYMMSLACTVSTEPVNMNAQVLP